MIAIVRIAAPSLVTPLANGSTLDIPVASTREPRVFPHVRIIDEARLKTLALWDRPARRTGHASRTNEAAPRDAHVRVRLAGPSCWSASCAARGGRSVPATIPASPPRQQSDGAEADQAQRRRLRH